MRVSSYEKRWICLCHNLLITHGQETRWGLHQINDLLNDNNMKTHFAFWLEWFKVKIITQLEFDAIEYPKGKK